MSWIEAPENARIFSDLCLDILHSLNCPYHLETITVICSANQWNGFYMIETSVMKELVST